MDTENSSSYRTLTTAALKALREDGWAVRPASGHGKANVHIMSKGDQEGRVSIRTSRDRWFAYQPQNGGKNWKTLDGVDWVCVASYDDKENPSFINVDLFDADDVRQRFHQAYQARHQAGSTPGDGFGMWVALDDHKNEGVAFVGGGIVSAKTKLAKYAITGEEVVEEDEEPEEAAPPPARLSVSEVLDAARQEIASLMGLTAANVTLEVHIKA